MIEKYKGDWIDVAGRVLKQSSLLKVAFSFQYISTWLQVQDYSTQLMWITHSRQGNNRCGYTKFCIFAYCLTCVLLRSGCGVGVSRSSSPRIPSCSRPALSHLPFRATLYGSERHGVQEVREKGGYDGWYAALASMVGQGRRVKR